MNQTRPKIHIYGMIAGTALCGGGVAVNKKVVYRAKIACVAVAGQGWLFQRTLCRELGTVHRCVSVNW